MSASEQLELMLTQVLDVFPLKCWEPGKRKHISLKCSVFGKIKNKQTFNYWYYQGKSKSRLKVPPRNSVGVPWNHSLCDFRLIFRIWDSSRPCSNTLLLKTIDLLERVWLISKLKSGLVGWLLPPFRLKCKLSLVRGAWVDQCWNVPFLTLRGGRRDGKGQ